MSPTIGGMPSGMIYIGEKKYFKYPHYIILTDTKEDAERELRRYMLNLELGINFFNMDSQDSADWLVQQNNRYIESYKKAIETIKSDLEIGCKEIEI